MAIEFKINNTFKRPTHQKDITGDFQRRCVKNYKVPKLTPFLVTFQHDNLVTVDCVILKLTNKSVLVITGILELKNKTFFIDNHQNKFYDSKGNHLMKIVNYREINATMEFEV